MNNTYSHHLLPNFFTSHRSPPRSWHNKHGYLLFQLDHRLSIINFSSDQSMYLNLEIVGALGRKGGENLKGTFLICRMLGKQLQEKRSQHTSLHTSRCLPTLSSPLLFSSHLLSFFHSDSEKEKKSPAITLILISSFSPPSPLASPLPFCQGINPHHQQATGDRGNQRPHRLCIPDREKQKDRN